MQLLVASAGGHLTQLRRLRPWLDSADDVALWVTYDSSQGRALQRDHDVVFGHGPSTRNVRAAVHNHRLATQLLGSRDCDRVVSTGAGIAVPFLVEAARRGLDAVYVESATRTHGPSLSGRILEHVPGVACYSQWPWHRRRWGGGLCVFDVFSPQPAASSRHDERQILVTLGTHRGYGFRRLVDQVMRLVKPTDRVVWQTGPTPAPGHIGHQVGPLGPAEFARLVERSDVIIGHAGIGTALTAMERGKLPILVPRRRAHGEHVDDHQVSLARFLDDRRLALGREVEALTEADFDTAAHHEIVRATGSLSLTR
jgi:UDP-N-acetylglucosamine transferase subunit ALG13